MFDVRCYWQWRSVDHGGPPTSQARNTDLVHISDVGAEYECADWLPASSTCCSSGSRRINRARSFSGVLPCYTTAAAGVSLGTPIVPLPPCASSCPSLVRSTGRVEGDDRERGADRVLAGAWRPWFWVWPLMRPEWKATAVGSRCRYLVGIQRCVNLTDQAFHCCCLHRGWSSLSGR